jgi:hypothetical protein
LHCFFDTFLSVIDDGLALLDVLLGFVDVPRPVFELAAKTDGLLIALPPCPICISRVDRWIVVNMPICFPDVKSTLEVECCSGDGSDAFFVALEDEDA